MTRYQRIRLLEIAEEVFSLLMSSPQPKRILELQNELLRLYPGARIHPVATEKPRKLWREPKVKNKIPRLRDLGAVADEIVAKWSKRAP